MRKQRLLLKIGKAEVAQLVEQLICNQLVGGSSPFFGSVLCSILFYFKEVGEIVKRSTTTDCKSVLSEFEGSNPSLPTKEKRDLECINLSVGTN